MGLLFTSSLLNLDQIETFVLPGFLMVVFLGEKTTAYVYACVYSTHATADLQLHKLFSVLCAVQRCHQTLSKPSCKHLLQLGAFRKRLSSLAPAVNKGLGFP